MSIPNTTHRILVEKLGGSDPASFIGNEGEVFYDPDAGSPTLRLSDGSTAGGIAIGGGGGSVSLNTVLGVGNTSDLGMSVGISTFEEIRVNTVQGTGEVGVTRMLLQASNNGNSYISIPTDDDSTTTNLIIGNELRGIQIVGGVVLDSDIENPQLSGGSSGSPTNIPLTIGYAVLNEGNGGGQTWFNLPDGQEGQLFHLIVGLTNFGTGGTAADFSITIEHARYTVLDGGAVQPVTGPIVWNPFVTETVPVSMTTLLYAQNNWNIGIGGTVTPD